MTLAVAPERLKRCIDDLAEFNATPNEGVTRAVYTKEYRQAVNYVKQQMVALGLNVREDCLGNIFGELLGSNQELPQVWTGSHIDTVTHGGRFDGVAGVAAGLEALRVIKESGLPHARTIAVNVYAGEEMSRFGICCIGSRALAGQLEFEELANRKGNDGKSLAVVLEQEGYVLKNFVEEFPCTTDIAASLELHIEQNNVLEQNHLQVGIVTGICAPTNLLVEVSGVQSHAGGTSMSARHDAYMAAAEMSLALEKLAHNSSSEYLTATIGEIYLEPNMANVIPGKARFTVDIRSVSIDDKNDLVKQFMALTQQISVRRQVSVNCTMLNNDKPLLCDKGLCNMLHEKIQEYGIRSMDLISGPYHDSLFLGELTRVGMIFVPSRDGISHAQAEYTALADIVQGTEILAATLYELAQN